MAGSDNKRKKIRRDKLGRRTDNTKKWEINKMIRLRDTGLGISQIADQLTRNARTVRKHLEEAGRKELSLVLCSCLTNPYLNMPNRYAQYPLELNGQDWRLDPITWFHLCTPDLSEEGQAYWEVKYPSLKKHLKNSPFRKHYLKLWQEVLDLDKAYQEAAEELGKTDNKFQKKWIEIQFERTRYFPPSRVPFSLEPDWGEWEPCYDREFCDKVMKEFEGKIDNLVNRLCGLEELLQQLNDDVGCP